MTWRLYPCGQILLLTIAATPVIRAWIHHRTVLAREQARIERLRHSIDGTLPQQRPEILRACNLLEDNTKPPTPKVSDESADSDTPPRN